MTIKRPKICLLFCGGSTLDPDNFLESTVKKEKDIDTWMSLIPEIQIIAEIDCLFLAAQAENEPHFWKKIARTIFLRRAEYDGFALICDLASILFTAAALSLTLQIGKPIILSGSEQLTRKRETPTLFESSGLKVNLINAVQLATMDLGEVALMFGNKLIRGNRALPNNNNSLNLFLSYKMEELAHLDFGISLSANRARRKTFDPEKPLRANFATNATGSALLPGMNLSLEKEKWSKAKYLFLTSPAPLDPKVEKILDSLAGRKPVLVYGAADSSGDFLTVNNLTQATAYVKFLYGLAYCKNTSALKEFFKKDLAGEIAKD